jgi:hypothetical protein
MTEKTYLVRLKAPSNALQHVRADSARLYGDGEHLVFVDSQGRLAALFLTEIVESWNEIAS